MSACLALSSLQPHARFVSAPETRAAIQSRLLSRGIWREDVEDETQNVLAKLYEADPTPTLEDCVALGRHIASQHAVDCLRRRSRRGKHNVGLTEAADEHAQDDNAAASLLDSIDRKRELRVIEGEFRAGRLSKRQQAIIARAADGYNDVEIARSLRLANQTVRNDLALTRKIARSAWAKYVGALGALGVAMLVLFWLRHRQEEATSAPHENPRPPSVPQSPPVQGPHERAAELRRNALHDCDVGDVRDCLKGLDAAKELDPAGDTAPAVQKARQKIGDIQRAPDTKTPHG